MKVKSMSYISIVKTYSFTGEQHIFITNNSKSELGEHFPPRVENTKHLNDNCTNSI